MSLLGKTSVGSGRNKRVMRRAPWWANSKPPLFLAMAGMLIGAKFAANVIGYVIFFISRWYRNLWGDAYRTKRLFDHSIDVANNTPFHWKAFFTVWSPFPYKWTGPANAVWLAWVPLIICLGLAIFGCIRLWLSYQSWNNNEHGAETFSTISEIKKTYDMVPDRVQRFDGEGGLVMSHVANPAGSLLAYIKRRNSLLAKIKVVDELQKGSFPLGKYAIENATVNALIIGAPRSFKGESILLPTIDNIGRAREQLSMVLNDSKSELATMSAAVLQKRGYRTYILNLVDLSRSMGYNPLEVAIVAAKRGDYDGAQRLVNQISTAIFHSEGKQDGNSKFWDESSTNLLNALIFAQMDLAQRHRDDPHSWDRVTLHNVYEMMTDLGSKNVPVDTGDQTIYERALKLYFDGLSIENEEDPDSPDNDLRRMALDAFAQSNFAGGETAGNIYASMMSGIKIYQNQDIAKLTSTNSLNLRQFCFPRVLNFQTGKTYRVGYSSIKIIDTDSGKTLEQRDQAINNLSYVDYVMKTKLPHHFRIEIHLVNNAGELGSDEWLEGIKNSNVKGDTHVKITKQSENLNDVELDYSEKPVAVFMVTPPNNPSYKQIATFFADQVFTQNYELATLNGHKAFTGLRFLYDEFASAGKIPNIASKLSIAPGYNILFYIVLQSLSQLEENYSRVESEDIQNNCGNWIYLKTENQQTAEMISKRLGNTTSSSFSHRGGDSVTSVQKDLGSANNTATPIMSATELQHLASGETIVLRNKREDKHHRPIRNNPIFNHGRTLMFPRFWFLDQTFDGDKSLNDLRVRSPYLNLSLKKNGYDYGHEFELVTGTSLQPSDDVETLTDDQTVPTPLPLQEEAPVPDFPDILDESYSQFNQEAAIAQANLANRVVQRLSELGQDQMAAQLQAAIDKKMGPTYLENNWRGVAMLLEDKSDTYVHI